MEAQELIKQRYERVAAMLDERARRAVAASEALSVGRGGIALVARATGLSRKAITLGGRELRGAVPLAAAGHIRRAGGGRKPLEAQDPTVRADLERLVDPTTRGDPESPLRWTGTSVRRLASELRAQGHRISHEKVAQLLRAAG
jgi:hypothetical protein